MYILGEKYFLYQKTFWETNCANILLYLLQCLTSRPGSPRLTQAPAPAREGPQEKILCYKNKVWTREKYFIQRHNPRPQRHPAAPGLICEESNHRRKLLGDVKVKGVVLRKISSDANKKMQSQEKDLVTKNSDIYLEAFCCRIGCGSNVKNCERSNPEEN